MPNPTIQDRRREVLKKYIRKEEIIGNLIRTVPDEEEITECLSALDKIDEETNNILLTALQEIADREWVNKIADKDQLRKWINEFVYVAKTAITATQNSKSKGGE